jgi:hypothetical protein
VKVVRIIATDFPYHFVIALWRNKKAESTPMNPWNTITAIFATLFASLALADDFKTNDGKEHKSATVTRVDADGSVIKTKGGISKLYFT